MQTRIKLAAAPVTPTLKNSHLERQSELLPTIKSNGSINEQVCISYQKSFKSMKYSNDINIKFVFTSLY